MVLWGLWQWDNDWYIYIYIYNGKENTKPSDVIKYVASRWTFFPIAMYHQTLVLYPHEISDHSLQPMNPEHGGYFFPILYPMLIWKKPPDILLK